MPLTNRKRGGSDPAFIATSLMGGGTSCGYYWALHILECGGKPMLLGPLHPEDGGSMDLRNVDILPQH